jgi:hypothetical protein
VFVWRGGPVETLSLCGRKWLRGVTLPILFQDRHTLSMVQLSCYVKYWVSTCAEMRVSAFAITPMRDALVQGPVGGDFIGSRPAEPRKANKAENGKRLRSKH